MEYEWTHLIESAISRRERHLQHLQLLATGLENHEQFVDKNLILSLVRALRKDVTIICETIPLWRKSRSLESQRHYFSQSSMAPSQIDAQAQFAPFIWKGEDYIQKLLRDTDFVAESPKLAAMIGFSDPRKACFNPLLSVHKDALAGKSPSLPKIAEFLVNRLFAEDQSELIGQAVSGYEDFLIDPVHESLGLTSKTNQANSTSRQKNTSTGKFDSSQSHTLSNSHSTRLSKSKAAITAANTRSTTQITPIVKNPAMSTLHLPLVISNKSIISHQTWQERGGRQKHIGMDEILDSDVMYLLEHKHVRDFIDEIRVVNTIAFLESENARKMRMAEAVAIMEAVSDNVRRAVDAVTIADEDISKGLSSLTLQIQDIQRKNIQSTFHTGTKTQTDPDAYPKPKYSASSPNKSDPLSATSQGLLSGGERFRFPFLQHSSSTAATPSKDVHNKPIENTTLPVLTPAGNPTGSTFGDTGVDASISRTNAIRSMAVESVRGVFLNATKQHNSVLYNHPAPPVTSLPIGHKSAKGDKSNDPSNLPQSRTAYPINPKTGSIFSPVSVDPSIPMGNVLYENVKSNMEKLSKPSKLEPLPMFSTDDGAGPFAQHAIINAATMPFSGSFLFSNDPVKASEAFLKRVTNEPVQVTDLASYALARASNPNFSHDSQDTAKNPINLTLRNHSRVLHESNNMSYASKPFFTTNPHERIHGDIGHVSNGAPNEHRSRSMQMHLNAQRLSMLRDTPFGSSSGTYSNGTPHNTGFDNGYPQARHTTTQQGVESDPAYIRTYSQEFLEQQMQEVYAETIAKSRQRQRNQSRSGLSQTAPPGQLNSHNAPDQKKDANRSVSRKESRKQMYKELQRATKRKSKPPHMLPHRTFTNLSESDLAFQNVSPNKTSKKPLLELQVKLLEAKVQAKEDDYEKVISLTKEYNQRRADEASLRNIYHDPLLNEEQYHSLKTLIKAKNTEQKIHRQKQSSSSNDPMDDEFIDMGPSLRSAVTPPGTILSRRKHFTPIPDPSITPTMRTQQQHSPQPPPQVKLDFDSILPPKLLEAHAHRQHTNFNQSHFSSIPALDYSEHTHPMDMFQPSPLYSTSPRYTAVSSSHQYSPASQASHLPPLSLRSIYTQPSTASSPLISSNLNTPVPLRYSSVHVASNTAKSTSPTSIADFTPTEYNSPSSLYSQSPTNALFSNIPTSYEEFGMVATNEEQRRLQNEIEGLDMDDVSSVFSEPIGQGLPTQIENATRDVRKEKRVKQESVIADASPPEHSWKDKVFVEDTLTGEESAPFHEDISDAAVSGQIGSRSPPDVAYSPSYEPLRSDISYNPSQASEDIQEQIESYSPTDGISNSENNVHTGKLHVHSSTFTYENLPNAEELEYYSSDESYTPGTPPIQTTKQGISSPARSVSPSTIPTASSPPRQPLAQVQMEGIGSGSGALQPSVPKPKSRPSTAQLQVLEAGLPFSSSYRTLSKQSITMLHPDNLSRRNSASYDLISLSKKSIADVTSSDV